MATRADYDELMGTTGGTSPGMGYLGERITAPPVAPVQARPQVQAAPAASLGAGLGAGPVTANPIASNQELYDTMAGRINRYMAVPSAKRDPYGRGDLEADIGRGSFSPDQQSRFQGLFNPQPVFVGSEPPARTRGY